MTDDIQVMADGSVYVGNGNWYSFDRIQQAVLEKQNPGLSVNCPEGEQRKRKIANITANDSQEEHLPLPSTLRANVSTDHECTCDHKPSMNTREDNEHLVMPSSYRTTK